MATFDSQGRVYVVHSRANEVHCYLVNVSGYMVILSKVRTRQNGSAIAFAIGGSPVGMRTRFAAVVDYDAAELAAFEVAGDHWLTRNRLPTGTAPMMVAMHPSGRFAYVPDNIVDTLQLFAIDPTSGSISAVGSGNSGVTEPRAKAFDPTGRFAYVVSFIANLAHHTVEPTTGYLTPQSSYPIAQALAAAVGPTGQFLYVARGGGVNTIGRFVIDPDTGSLGSFMEFAAGHTPGKIAIHPSGCFLYDTDYADSTISAFAIHPITGELSPAGTIAAPSHPTAIAIHPDGRHLYAGSTDSDTVMSYFVNRTTGSLTQNGSPMAFSYVPDMAADANEELLYMVNQNQDSVTIFHVDSGLGDLEKIETGLPLFVRPTAVALTTEMSSCIEISVGPQLLPRAEQGQPYSANVTASGGGGPYFYRLVLGPMPPGLTFASNGTISGTPTASGGFLLQVEASDMSGCRGFAFIILVVRCSGVTIQVSPPQLPAAIVGTPYSLQLSAIGGTPPHSFGILQGELPYGLSLTANGLLAGRPPAPATS